MSDRSRWRQLSGENLRIAFEALRSQRMRSLLLILGVSIGTATLLAMISLLFGLKEKLREDIVSREPTLPHHFQVRLSRCQGSQGGRQPA